MATVRPFRPLRPPPERAAAVSAVPYDVVSTAEARALAAGNPLSFLHVSRPEIDLPDGTDPHSDAVYERAAENFRTLEREAPLAADPEPALFLYRLRMDGREQTGVAGVSSLDEYDRDVIRKHERTRRDKEDDRTRHMLRLSRADGAGLPDLSRPGGDRRDRGRGEARGAALRLHGAGRCRAHALAARPGAESRAARRGLRARAPPLHRRRAPPRGERRARAPGARARQTRGHTRRRALQLLPDGDLSRPGSSASSPTTASSSTSAAARRRSSGRSSREVPARDAAPRPPRRARARSRVYLAGRWYAPSSCPPPSGPGADRGRSTPTASSAPCSSRSSGSRDVRTDKRIDFVGGIRGTAALEKLVDSGQGGRRLLDVPRLARGAPGRLRRGRDHAAQEHLVRAEAAGRTADPRDLRG